MTATPPPPPPVGGKTDSGEHVTISGRGVKVRIPWRAVGGAAKYVGPTILALGSLIAGRVQHDAVKADADKAAKNVDVAYKTLAAPANESAAEIKQLRLDLAALADTVRLHGKLLLSAQPGFTATGLPGSDGTTPGHRRRPDAALVRKVQEATSAKLPAIQARASAVPPVPTVPKEIPAEPPPVPAKPRDAGGANP